MQTWPLCVLISSLSLYTSCSGHLILSLWVFLNIFSTASIFTDKKVCEGFGEEGTALSLSVWAGGRWIKSLH